jgi:serine/threonine-protein kinase ULK/ATG1
MSQIQKNMMLRESKFLRQLNHPNILKCHDFMDKGLQFYLVTEYCPLGDIYAKLTTEGPFSEYVAFHLMKGVANALLALKKTGIVHRDLKPSNVLLKDGIPKLADFGFAIHER